jgi:16S rRNA (guanine527-N7)-methyltransferase
VTSKEFRDRLLKRLRKLEIRLTGSQVTALEKYYRLLVLWNARINLTALRLDPPDEASFDRLLIEPLSAARFVPAGSTRLLDIGSGSGSPAIPLAIAVTPTFLTMVESKTRKAVFLLEAVRQLELTASVEAARYEQLLSRPDLHESIDVLTIRAVRVEPRSLLSLQAFIKPGGQLFWFRSPAGTRPMDVPPPLTWFATHTLGDATDTRLAILSKNAIGRVSAGADRTVT